MFTNHNDTTVVKKDGELSGQPVAIENCQNSLILLLDNLASATVDDCKNCLIILGPCQGSIFIRDCENCVILAACQQFRTRGSSLFVHLRCTTAPIIEETKAQIWPLEIDYPGYKAQLERSELGNKPNLFNDVQDFTPDISELHIQQSAIDQDQFKNQMSFLENVEKMLEQEKIQFGSEEL